MSKSLTLSKLSEYDDILTDHLIDKVYFWITTHKADRKQFHSSRNARTDEIVHILKTYAIPSKGKLRDACQAFLQLPTIHSFSRNLSTSEAADFERHMRKYLSIYLPNAGFEISSTLRYERAGPKKESCVIVNRNFAKGEHIRHLAGTIVAMTQEEEDFYEAGHDFSIIHSSRLDSMCLFLGPARFVNHDCSPNGTFVTQGTSVSIATTKPVAIGEELTVFYSPDYFGPNNADCMCATCERKGTGFFRSEEQKVTDAELLSATEFPESPVTGRSRRVDAVELRPRVETADVVGIGSARQLITPPDSELSLEDIAKIAYLSSDDEFHSMPEDSDEEDEEKPMINPTTSMSTIPSLQPLTAHDLAIPLHKAGEESPERMSLRPRKQAQDYNLARQSAASISTEVIPGLPRTHDIGANYCQLCDSLLPASAVPLEVWSNNSIVGALEPLICQRCERHSKLYDCPWPDRIAPSLKSLADRQNNRSRILDGATDTKSFATSDSARSLELDLVMPELGTLAKEWRLMTRGWQHASLMEPAKAQMRRGGLYMPRLAQAFQYSATTPFPCWQFLRFQQTFARPARKPHRLGCPSNQCVACFDKHKKCVRTGTTSTRCDRCIRLRKTCSLDGSVSQGTRRELSPDSTLAALQVKSLYKVNRNREPTAKGALKSFSRQPRSASSSDSDHEMESNIMPSEKMHGRKRARSQTYSDTGANHSSRPSSPKKAKARHSWFYVEVQSDEEDKKNGPILLEGRTRRQTKFGIPEPSRASTPGTAPPSPPIRQRRRRRTIIHDSEDEMPHIAGRGTTSPIPTDAKLETQSAPPYKTRSLRCLSPTPTTSRPTTADSAPMIAYTPSLDQLKKSRMRKPRLPRWEYISINSEDEREAEPIILDNRTRRRKSEPMYRV